MQAHGRDVAPRPVVFGPFPQSGFTYRVSTLQATMIKLKRVYAPREPSDEFRQRYAAELDANSTAWQPIAQAANRNVVTLLFSAHDVQHNNAVALKEFLEAHLTKGSADQ
jgi:hypothetical protein